MLKSGRGVLKIMSAINRLGLKNTKSKTKYDGISIDQKQTADCFGFKWAKRETYESENVKTKTQKWLIERYCNDNLSLIGTWLGSDKKKIILDAGCGSGMSAMLFWGDFLNQHDYLGVDISDSVDIAKKRFQEAGYSGEFLQRSLLDLDDIPDESVDIIFSEGVLHHTDNTEESIKYLSKKVKRSGRFLFYVYAKKAVIREFTDDYIREHIKDLSDTEAWNVLESLTKLGIALGELSIDFEVPEDIPYLGIQKGNIDLQRFFYWNILKLFYRPEYSIDEMNHINFDWFRPSNCHRHTPEEIKTWCTEAGMIIEHINIQEAGITVVAQKK